MTEPTIGWGILGAGRIAKRFAADSKLLEDARLVAVGSRSLEKAQAFAGENGVERAYSSYVEMVQDPDVDAVYVATPHPFHKEHTLLSIDHGKAVLCEKPMEINGDRVAAMAQAAREKDVFLMEAMWTRFLPVVRQVQAWIAEGRIGEVRMLTVDFGFRARWNPENRLFVPALAGGALLDVGVYTIAFASMVYGGAVPARVQALAHIGETGVDEQTAMQFIYDGGALAQLSCAIRTLSPHNARIDGTEGAIEIPRFWHPTSAKLITPGNEQEVVMGEQGFHFEIAEAMRCIASGKIESDILPLDESIAIARTTDRVREQIGLVYPME